MAEDTDNFAVQVIDMTGPPEVAETWRCQDTA